MLLSREWHKNKYSSETICMSILGLGSVFGFKFNSNDTWYFCAVIVIYDDDDEEEEVFSSTPPLGK